MKEPEKKKMIVPYVSTFGGNMIGDIGNNYIGYPIFITEEPEEDVDEL